MADEAVRTGVDTAGGGIIGPGSPIQSILRDQGQAVAVFAEPVQNHGTGGHASATMVGSNNVLRAAGVLACRLGDAATCGHTATGSGVLRLPSP